MLWDVKLVNTFLQGMDEVTTGSEDDHEGTATVGAMDTGVGKEEAGEGEVDEQEEENQKGASEVEAAPTSSKKVHPLFGR